MTPRSPLHRRFIAVYLLAAGCATQEKEAFLADQQQLECEIEAACGLDVTCSDLTDPELSEPTCWTLDREGATACLEGLEEMLMMVEANPDRCSMGMYIPECLDVLERRDGPRCSGGGLGPSMPVDGRPLLHEGQVVLAEVRDGQPCPQLVLPLGELDATVAAEAAAHWLQAARQEQASVPAFGRVAHELRVLGAPSRLVDRCQRAALDEIRHTRLTLALARSLGGCSWALGPVPAVPARAVSLREVAIEALLHGCVGEGAAAARLHVAAERAREPVAVMLRSIAEDETRHAALACATLRWALERDPSLAPPLREALDRVAAGGLATAVRASAAQSDLGVVSESEALAIERELVTIVVRPVLDRLLQSLGCQREVSRRRAGASARRGLDDPGAERLSC